MLESHIVMMSNKFLACAQLQSLTYLPKVIGSATKWPSLGFNNWDTCRNV